VSGFIQFVDIMGASSGKVPVKGPQLIALYATGSDGIEATAAQILRFKNAGVGVILLDQTPSQSVLAVGLADVGDIESLAGTYGAAADACKARASHGWQTTLYVGNGNLAALTDFLKAAGVDMTLVLFGVADYNWSLAEAEQLLDDNSDWAYVQYGDNITNAGTLIPGTDVTCAAAGCDIDVAKSSWGDQFLPGKPKPVVVVTAGPKPTTTILANNNDLQFYADQYEISEAQLLEWNPGLRDLYGTGKPIPAGTKLAV
jgi:hypothetical protein